MNEGVGGVDVPKALFYAKSARKKRFAKINFLCYDTFNSVLN